MSSSLCVCFSSQSGDNSLKQLPHPVSLVWYTFPPPNTQTQKHHQYFITSRWQIYFNVVHREPEIDWSLGSVTRFGAGYSRRVLVPTLVREELSLDLSSLWLSPYLFSPNHRQRLSECSLLIGFVSLKCTVRVCVGGLGLPAWQVLDCRSSCKSEWSQGLITRVWSWFWSLLGTGRDTVKSGTVTQTLNCLAALSSGLRTTPQDLYTQGPKDRRHHEAFLPSWGKVTCRCQNSWI